MNEENNSTGEEPDWPLLTLKMKKGVHEPKNMASRNWEWPSFYSQHENGDLGLTIARSLFLPIICMSRKWILS